MRDTGGMRLTAHSARSFISSCHSSFQFAPVPFRLRHIYPSRFVVGATSLALIGSTRATAQARPDTAVVTVLLATHPWLGNGGQFADVQRAIRGVREADGAVALRWTTDAGRPTGAAAQLLAHVGSDGEASRAEQADAVRLDSAARAFSVAAASASDRRLFDVALDIIAARHAYLHAQGRVDPTRVHPEWSLAAADVDLRTVLTRLAGDAGPADVFSALEPQTRAYGMLVSSLEAVRRHDADGATRRPARPAHAIGAGQRYADATALADVLVQLGELPTEFPVRTVGTRYTKPMFDAVARWQNRKLKKGRATGTLTAPLLAALMEEYDGRGDRIAMAIERWRWLPRTFSNDPLVVNLPEYRLHSYLRFQGNPATDSISMNVVIGRADSNATPVFAANMTQVVFSPQWHVPKSIMLKEILPAATASGDYLAKHDYELTTTGGRVIPTTPGNIARIGTTVMVRQRSGDANALGKVKFLLPNPYDIYLHDTPSRSFFRRVRRDFSHGCVRLDDPMALARYVLGSQPAWNDSKITEAMNAGVERYVRVPRPIPVLIVYQTAVADAGGRVRYFNDVYGHDSTLHAAMVAAR